MANAKLATAHLRPEAGFSGLWWVGAACLSCALHAGLYATLSRPTTVALQHNSQIVMEVESAPKPPPPPPPPEVKKPKPAVAKQAPPVSKPPPIVPKSPPPPPSRAPKGPPPPVHIGLSLSSTSQTGDFAAPVGNSMYGKAPTTAADANNVRPTTQAAPAIVPSYAVSEAPLVDAEPDLQAYYPEDARKQNLEGQVTLMLTIDASGAVTHAKVLRSAGNGFDEAAVRAATEKLHFKPARLNGHPVGTEITYKITFLLD